MANRVGARWWRRRWYRAAARCPGDYDVRVSATKDRTTLIKIYVGSLLKIKRLLAGHHSAKNKINIVKASSTLIKT